MLDSENQSFRDAFEYRYSWTFCKFHRTGVSFLIKLPAFNYIKETPTQVFTCEIFEHLFLQNTSGGCFWKIHLDRPEKGGYMILTKNVCSFLTEVTSSASSECLQLYLKNFNVETELRQPISPSQRLCVTFL